MHDDLGARCPRWAGVRSEHVDVDGVRVHLLRADASPDAPSGASTSVLLHGMGSTAAAWLDVIGPLTALGPVLAVDLPGAGRTAPLRRRGAGPDAHVRLLSTLVATLGLDRVVLHGWSMGGLVAALFAGLEPARVERLVLVNPALPAPLGPGGTLVWQTVGRLALLVGAPLARALLRLYVRRMSASGQLPATGDLIGGDLSRMSPEITAVLAEERRWALRQPWRLDGYVTQWFAVASALFVSRRPVTAAIARIRAPVLLLWGDDDPLIGRPTIDRLIAQRPDWRLHVLPSVGHAPPLEAPAEYVQVVARSSADVASSTKEGT